MDRLAAPDALPPGSVLTQAACRAGAWLGLSDEELRRALGLERLGDELQLGSTSWYSALSLIQLAFRLDRLTGGRDDARRWLRGPNTRLSRPPVERLVEPGGARDLLDYTHAFYR